MHKEASGTPAPAIGADFPGIDLDMLAYDIADMLDRNEYDIDVASNHIRPALTAFLREITANAAADDSGWEAEAMHAGEDPGDSGSTAYPLPEAAVTLQHGRLPTMTCAPGSGSPAGWKLARSPAATGTGAVPPALAGRARARMKSPRGGPP